MKTSVALIVLIIVLIGGFLLFNQRQEQDDAVSEIAFSFTALEALAQGHYEGWAIFGEEKVSTGKFNLDDDDLSFSSSRDLTEADMIVVTIEPEGDTDTVPSGVVVLEGRVEEGTAELQFPVDLSDVSGTYILATPTNDPAGDEMSGVWFVSLPGPQAGLTLPALPENWVYEGWVVFEGTPITTGRFTSVSGADGFDGYSGEEGGPRFPGEDFLVNAPRGLTFPIDLSNGTSVIVVSVEPDSDGTDPTGDGPFQVKPLVGEIPEGAGDHENFEMERDTSTIPSGSAVVSGV